MAGNRVVFVGINHKTLACGCSCVLGSGWRPCAVGSRLQAEKRANPTRETVDAWKAHFHPEEYGESGFRSTAEIAAEMLQEGL